MDEQVTERGGSRWEGMMTLYEDSALHKTKKVILEKKNNWASDTNSNTFY